VISLVSIDISLRTREDIVSIRSAMELKKHIAVCHPLGLRFAGMNSYNAVTFRVTLPSSGGGSKSLSLGLFVIFTKKVVDEF